jgi:hypothetical protein
LAGLEPGQDGYGNEGDRAESGDQLCDEDESDEDEITHAVPYKCIGAAQRRNEGLPTMHCVSLLFTITIFNERLAKSC